MAERSGVNQRGGMSSDIKTPANSTASGPGVLSSEGAIGKQFTEKGSIGSIGQAVGGPFDKEGAIGKQFTKDGSIGGTMENASNK
ncbi:hypothetical protein BT63DRAFT_482486 [Microthyrium microscopicum]|uniref:Uncharacterized protein n=1 Tax=Microthyrium microscopicum TaxID=703497 RepID=A0A6A6U2R2_9PEZI|nr:hypothetical protein BT63DRAFT_482486 [Microthyrium microscopicum]